jgi:sulfur-carrier protein
MIRVVLPVHLRQLVKAGREVELQVNSPVTLRAVLDALEAQYPALRGTIRDQVTLQRRIYIRFFACGEDLSHISPDALLPDPVINRTERFMIVGAMAGG